MSDTFVQPRYPAPQQGVERRRAVAPVARPAGPVSRQEGFLQPPVGLPRATKPSCSTRPEAAPSIGSLLYLGSIGLVAAGIVAVFFGTGFSLLSPPAGGTIFGSATRPASEIVPLPTRPGNDGQPPAPEAVDAARGSATLPAPAEAPLTTGDPAVAAPMPSAVAASPLARPDPVISSAELSELVQHGDSLLRTGDVASARLFYERAAGGGDGGAALRLGATFDPAFLGRLGFGKRLADVAAARSWYSRALDLGAAEAKNQLNSLDARQGK